jgi:Rad3-related DNA helicase
MSIEWQIINRVTVRPMPDAIGWLNESIVILRQRYQELSDIIKDGGGDSKTRKQLRRCEMLGKKVSSTLHALITYPDDWYIKSGKRARTFRGNKVPGFVCKPLTARHHAPSYFISDDWDTILMSATIGDPVAFSEELGIDDYTYHQVPSEWTPDVRPIEVLAAPVMSRKNTLKHPSAFEKQADVIAEAIHDCNESWSGLILVTRKSEAGLLAGRLAERGLQDRVWVTPGNDGVYVPTDHQVNAWHKRLRQVPNSICLSWSLWTGYDGLDEKILVAAKSPAPFLGDGFERARMEYSRRFYNWRTGCTLAQGLGRIRRGRACDYNVNGQVNKRVFIADGSWRRIKKSLPAWMMEAVVT